MQANIFLFLRAKYDFDALLIGGYDKVEIKRQRSEVDEMDFSRYRYVHKLKGIR